MKSIFNLFISVSLLAFSLTIATPVILADETELPPLTINWEWSEENRGPKGPSPEITVGQIPTETVKLTIKLNDFNRPNFSHGGGSIDIEKGVGEFTISTGALKKNYKGPYPPAGETHKYQFKVIALNYGDDVLAEGVAERTFKGK